MDDVVNCPFIVSVIGSIVTGVFAYGVLRRWYVKRHAHNLAWGIGLVMYCLCMSAQVILTLWWSPDGLSVDPAG